MADADANVVPLDVVTSVDINPERILRSALEAGMAEVVILGIDKDGDEYFASSLASGPETLWHLQRASYRLLKIVDDIPPRKSTPDGVEAQVIPLKPTTE